MNKKITVCIPVYNIEEYLEKCLESVVVQSYRNIEIIVVDDGSTDRSRDIAERFAKVDKRILVIHKDNEGLVSARKIGALNATGDYVVNIDGDDWIEEDYVYNFAKIINAEETYDIVWNMAESRDYGNQRLEIKNIWYKESELLNDAVQADLLEKAIGKQGYQDAINYHLSSKCIRRELYSEAQLSLDNRISYHEDVACLIRLVSKCRNVRFTEFLGYHYIQRDTSITHKPDDARKLDIVRNDTLKYLENSSDYDSTQRVVMGAYLHSMLVKNFEGLQVGEADCLYPFKRVKKGCRIVVYGMGTVGRNIVRFVEKSRDFALIACIDERSIDQKINRPEYLRIVNFDFVIISTVKAMYVNEIERSIVALGIPYEKIVSIKEI